MDGDPSFLQSLNSASPNSPNNSGESPKKPPVSVALKMPTMEQAAADYSQIPKLMHEQAQISKLASEQAHISKLRSLTPEKMAMPEPVPEHTQISKYDVTSSVFMSEVVAVKKIDFQTPTMTQVDFSTSTPEVSMDGDPSFLQSLNPASPNSPNNTGKSPNFHICPVCEKHFPYSSSLRRHMKLHQDVYTHQCAVCHRKFTREEHFVRHTCNRRPNKPCQETDVDSRLKGSPGIDFQTSTPAKNLEVSMDGDPSFLQSLNPASPNSPNNTRKSPKSHICPVCDKCFPYSSSFRRHMELHQGVYTHVCAVCDRKFTRKEHFVRHKCNRRPNKPCRGLEGEVKPSVTGKAFDTPESTASPTPSQPTLQRGHTSEMTTSETMTGKDKKADHMQQAQQPEAYTSPKYQSSSSPPAEQMTATQTALSERKQSNYLNLQKEMHMIGGKPCFVCPNCSKVFHRISNFSRHMRIHRGVFSYVCPTCNRGFFRKEHFQKHKCNRKAISYVWERKTKVDMDMQKASSEDGCNDSEGPVDDDEYGVDMNDYSMEASGESSTKNSNHSNTAIAVSNQDGHSNDCRPR